MIDLSKEHLGTHLEVPVCVMREDGERLAVVIVLVGVLLLLMFAGSFWLPLSANMDMPSFHSSRPAIPDWPRHEWPNPRV